MKGVRSGCSHPNLAAPKRVVARDEGNGLESHVGKDGPFQPTKLQQVRRAGPLEGTAAGDGEGARGVEAGVEGGGVEDGFVSEKALDRMAGGVGAVHRDATGMAHQPATDLETILLRFGIIHDHRLMAFLKKKQTIGVGGGTLA